MFPTRFREDKYFVNCDACEDLSSLNLVGNTVLQIKNCGMPLDTHYFNPYQQTTSEHHKNDQKRPTIIYHNLFYHRTILQSQTHQNKTIRHYQYPFESTVSKIKWFICLQNQNKMSILSLTWILKKYLIFLFFCIYHETPTWDIWSQSTRYCDLIFPWKRRITRRITP